jgi:hypothetical protein
MARSRNSADTTAADPTCVPTSGGCILALEGASAAVRRRSARRAKVFNDGGTCPLGCRALNFDAGSGGAFARSCH